MPTFSAGNLVPFAPQGFTGIAESAALLFFAYTGYARIATLREEVREPQRTIPRAVAITIAAAVLLYSAVALVAVGNAGAAALAETASPLQRAARDFQLPGVPLVVGVGATAAMLGVLLSQIVGISRMMFAMARRGDLPGALQHTSERHGVPDRGILLSGAVIVLLSIFGTLEWVLSAAAFTILLYYLIANIAALRLAAEDKMYPRWVAMLGAASCVLLALSLDLGAIVAGLALLAVGFVLRWLFGKSEISS